MTSTFEARTIFRQLGAGEVSAQLATQWAFHKPSTSDPSSVVSRAVIVLVQKGLNQAGFTLTTNGNLDPITQSAIEGICGPSWRSRTWLEIAKEVLLAKGSQSSAPSEGLGNVGMVSQAGGLLLVAGIVFLAMKLKR